MNVLIDTTVWSLALRRKPEHLNAAETKAAAELAELIQEGRARIIGPIRQELLSGIRTSRQYEDLRDTLGGFPDEPIVTSDYEAAAKITNDCRAQGVVVSPVDALICAIAAKHNFPVFTVDGDFQHYASVLSIKLHMPRK